MKIAVLLHSTAGGSGVFATELGQRLAKNGHEVHFVADQVPFRLNEIDGPGIAFHQIQSMAYPLFGAPLTTLAEASKLVEVIEEYGIELIHAHYAVPHATAALLARDIVRSVPKPAVVTTLHGTDVTLVGLNRAYLRTTQYSIDNSDVVTAVSHYLAEATQSEMRTEREIRVIPNAVDPKRFSRVKNPALRLRFAKPNEKLLVHVSNFRPVKRTGDVVKVFSQITSAIASRLLMIGDGPDRPEAFRLATELGITDQVAFLGTAPRVEVPLSVADIFLLPSEQESFGLAALEAMSSGVPVIGSKVGGLPEVVTHGETGFLLPVGDVKAMAQAGLVILKDPRRLASMRRAARDRAVGVFNEQSVVPLYEEAYRVALTINS
jgi:N-acetyl-alpha-D-glucosaminyl L-malate synthase BshA